MTEAPTKIIIDCSTGESSIVPLTDEEIAQLQADQTAAKAAADLAAKEAAIKAEKRAELLAKLGITEEEARILLG